MFVIAGATGRTGSVVAHTLLERGLPVTVLVRSTEKAAAWSAKGAKVVTGSLDDRRALVEALRGAAGVYLLVPPNYQAADYLATQRRVSEVMAGAVQDSAAGHVVLLSSIGAHRETGTGVIQALHHTEQRLSAVAPNLTIIRAAYFLENWLPMMESVRTNGVLPSFLTPSRLISMVATRDIGRIAAECLLDRPTGHRILELSGPREYSPVDVAEAAGRLFHRPVIVEQAPLTAALSVFTRLGFSENAARLFQEMYEGVETGTVTFQESGACRPRGLVTVEQVLHDALAKTGPDVTR